ncbi:MAG: hypothetical protein CVV42_12710 [Candidatus Riflebacteria bacterium HGW-Riflebacteria-2]|nr:MAG: hypothetical protein CVV42_12710 [Candidatus Riflebacteria bacterium HGW-Riflebacteria-2]
MPIDESISSLLKSPHEQDRKKAVAMLCRKPDRAAIIALQQTAEIDESLEIRFYARKALAAAKSSRRSKTENPLLMLLPEVLDTTTFLRFDDDEKCTLIKALIEQNRSSALPCFLELLPIEQNPRVLAAMIMAVGSFGSSAESRVLIPFLHHKDARVRANSIEALELLGNLKLFAYIFPLLEDTDNRVRANAARSLRSIEPFTSFRLLQAMISSGRTPFQASAIHVLRHFISDSSAALVAPFLDSSQEDLRRRAGQTIHKLAEKGVARAIELAATLPPLSEEPSPETEFRELDTQACSVEDCIARLEQAFTVPDSRMRLEAVEKESLQLGDKSVMPLLKYLERESDPLVVGKIYILLGRLYDVRALPCLLKGLRSQDDRCRANAVEAIGMLGEAKSLLQLVPFLKDPHNRVRGNAILALRIMKEADIVQPLEALVGSSEELYQRTAVYVLAELQRVELFPLLQKLLHSSFATVRKNAMTAVTALEKAGFQFRKEEPDVPAADVLDKPVDASGLPERSADSQLSIAGDSYYMGESATKIVTVDSSDKHQSAQDSASARKRVATFSGYFVVVAILALVLAIIILARVSIDVSGDRAAKEVLLSSAMAHAQDMHVKGLEVVAGISLIEKQASEVEAQIGPLATAAISAQKIIERLSDAIEHANEVSTEVHNVYLVLHKVSKVIGEHFQHLARVVEEVRKRLPDKQHPFTGLVDSAKTGAELVALARIKEDLRLSNASIKKLPPEVSHARSGLPDEALLAREYEKFARLGKYLPEAGQMQKTLDERMAVVARESAKTAEIKDTLVRVSPEDNMVTMLGDLQRSLDLGQERLRRCQAALASATRLAENIAPGQAEAELLDKLGRASAEIARSEKILKELPEIPGSLSKAQARIVRVFAILHQKVFAETVRLGLEADASTDWDAAVSREARKIAGLYARAHALNDVITSENALYFPDIDVSTLDEELKAAAASSAVASLYLANITALFEDSPDQSPPQSASPAKKD